MSSTRSPAAGPVVGVIQARMGSSRLPGKTMMEIAGAPVLAHVIARLRAARNVDTVVVATTVGPEDDVVEQEALRRGATVFRGSSQDVLGRYRGAAREHGAGAVVRVTADCPMLDPGVVTLTVERYLGSGGECDYAATIIDRSYPRGLDVEVFSMAALELVAEAAAKPDEREHVTLFFRRHPERFRLCSVKGGEDLSHLRWTVDTAEDLAFVRAAFDAAGISIERIPPYDEVARILAGHPEIVALNANVRQHEPG